MILSPLPGSAPPNLPLTWETWAIIFPYAATLAVVGLLASLMTSVIVDDLTGCAQRQKSRVSRTGRRQYYGGAVYFAHKVSHLVAVESILSADGNQRTYKVYGQVFFASADQFAAARPATCCALARSRC